ncbi:hypothetical protein [Streptomyces sp. NPDC051183]|uniref:hypothetical protein n=1 Tax=unclassified Streptomyces TaxID=2593676 RepID=UPI003438F72B
MTHRDRALHLLRTRPDLAALAAYPFGFDIGRADHVEEVELASGAALTPIAGTDTGGTYFLCAGGEVLFAGSEGEYALFGDSLDEALENIVGLPSGLWCEEVDPALDGPGLAALVAAADEEEQEYYEGSLAADRAVLLAGLGLRQRPVAELAARVRRALLRTEPDFLLLNSAEGGPYRLLHELPRPPLWETVLGSGRADLARMRADEGCWAEVMADDPRRATMTGAARYDRRATDLPLLRALLRYEAANGGTWDFLQAAVLVGAHGEAADHALVVALLEAEPHQRAALDEYGFPRSAEGWGVWARALDAAEFGDDPERVPPLEWARLAAFQGREQLARATFLRLLDGAGPRDGRLLGALASELAELGDFRHAARARRLYASLQDEPYDRGAALADLAALERRAGAPEAARQALYQAVGVLDSRLGPQFPPSSRPTAGWRRGDLGATLRAEHAELARAAEAAGLPALAHEVRVAADLLGPGIDTAAEPDTDTDTDEEPEPAEHLRYADYLRALEAVAEADEVALLAAVLRDPDEGMAESAVSFHLDGRAADLLALPGFPAWAGTMAEVIADRGFLTRRLREWTLLRTLALGEPWAAEELTGASDWFQRMVATTQIVSSPEALGLLAERGRTRRVRNAAERQLRDRPRTD